MIIIVSVVELGQIFVINFYISCFRLPQDVYQTAKVSKLLIAINKGKGAIYKGKSLEEIEFSDNVDSESESETETPDRSQAEKVFGHVTLDIPMVKSSEKTSNKNNGEKISKEQKRKEHSLKRSYLLESDSETSSSCDSIRDSG